MSNVHEEFTKLASMS